MLTSSERTRYARQLVLPRFGDEGQERLKAGSVLIIGAGGLGSPAAMYLAAAGVGRLGLVDFDTVDETNLHRQILYGTPDIGQRKLDVAAARLHELNPHVTIERHDEALTTGNALELIGRYDVIVDGTDNFPTRYLVNDACVLAGKPNVYGSIHRFDGQVSVFNAAGGPCYRCLYPEPPPPQLVPSCAEGGVLGVLPGIVGTLQATEAIKLLTGIGEPLIGRLLLIDALSMSFREMKLRRNPDCRVTELTDYELFCNPAREITPEQLAARLDRVTLIDVREPIEFAGGHLDGARLIPLGELPQRLGEIEAGKEIVVYCKMGGRSARAAEILREHGIRNVRSLAGGLDGWMRRR